MAFFPVNRPYQIPASIRTNYYPIALSLLAAMHLAGVIGLQHPVSRPVFEQLIVFNLLSSTALVLGFHRDFRPAFFLFCVIAFTGGYLVEVLGVSTGLIFGEYAYGSVLGPKWWNVPWMIGCNWLLLIYCTGVISHKLPVPRVIRALAGAGLMVLLDYFIEPVAIRHDFWSWENNIIPLQNYAAWFGASFILLLVFHNLPFDKKNPLAIWLYLIQLLFFMTHVLIYFLIF
jgi:uncharacterized membrane protein